MKATLTFDLPDEKDDFTAATKGMNYYLALWNALTNLRNEIKYNEGRWLAETGYEGLERAREILLDAMEEQGCTMEDIS